MLELFPHDFPHDQDLLPQHTITQANWKGEKWQIGIAGTALQNGARAIVCQKEGSPLLWLTRAGNIERPFHSLSESVSQGPTDPFGLRMTFAYSFGEERWARAFFLNTHFRLRRQDEDARFFLLLSPHGWAVCRDLTTILTPETLYRRQGEFMWSSPQEHNWLHLSSSQLLERVTTQFDDPSSDFNFSRTFTLLSLEERRNLMWPCQYGNLGEMERVLTWVLMAQEDSCNSNPNCTWAIKLEEQSRGLSYVYKDGNEEISSPALSTALRQVLNVFKPHRDSITIQQHLCLRLANYNNLYIEIDNPTFHERLEATLQWRDWLATHYP